MSLANGNPLTKLIWLLSKNKDQTAQWGSVCACVYLELFVSNWEAEMPINSLNEATHLSGDSFIQSKVFFPHFWRFVRVTRSGAEDQLLQLTAEKKSLPNLLEIIQTKMYPWKFVPSSSLRPEWQNDFQTQCKYAKYPPPATPTLPKIVVAIWHGKTHELSIKKDL